VRLLQGGDGFGELVPAEAVGLGADDEVRPVQGLKRVDEKGVALLRRNIGVHQADAKGQLLALINVGLDELGPLGRDGPGDLGVTIAGKVGEDQRWPGVEFRLGAVVERKEVDEETFASLEPSSVLIKDDLPTLERPRKATSGASKVRDALGKWEGSIAESRNFGTKRMV
jgi:hypothetical protein